MLVRANTGAGRLRLICFLPVDKSAKISRTDSDFLRPGTYEKLALRCSFDISAFRLIRERARELAEAEPEYDAGCNE
jgi:hypothetical protein